MGPPVRESFKTGPGQEDPKERIDGVVGEIKKGSANQSF